MKKLIILIVILVAIIVTTSNSQDQTEAMMRIALIAGVSWFGGLYVLFSYLFRDKKEKVLKMYLYQYKKCFIN